MRLSCVRVKIIVLFPEYVCGGSAEKKNSFGYWWQTDKKQEILKQFVAKDLFIWTELPILAIV